MNAIDIEMSLTNQSNLITMPSITCFMNDKERCIKNDLGLLHSNDRRFMVLQLR